MIRSLVIGLAVFVASFSMVSNAADIYDLQRSNQVEISAWVGEPSKPSSTTPSFSVNEQVILYIEVATPRWFTQGTRIGSVEIPNVIAKQRNHLATNYTKRVGGVTWARQRWEVTLYPQASGEVIVPSIPVEVGVSAEDGSKVAGFLYTQPIKFDTRLPSGLLTQDGNWFSASKTTFNQEWQSSQETLHVGDAITRTVRIDAEDSLSVLLPQMLTSESNEHYQAYVSPNRLDDTQSRGDYVSTREESITYVLQQGGEVSFPDYAIQWWNRDKQQVETIEIQGKTFAVKHTLSSWLKQYWLLVGIVLAGCLLLGFFVYVTKRYYQTHPTPVWLQFRLALQKKNWPQARRLIYVKQRRVTGSVELQEDNDTSNALGRFYRAETRKSLFMVIWRNISNKGAISLNNIKARLRFPKALPELERIKEKHQVE